ncbi:MAG: sigma-70 family RNA polymerase sigma factor [Gemmatimonadetes bacterium]|nr:sigma-70 family RNA polymerase sigma factor [Gemmatimonadota bacterium]
MDESGAHGDVTRLLKELSGGDRKALESLVPKVYEELRVIAQRHLRNEAEGHTLNATALVHEAYVRIAQLDRIDWQDRAHFFAVASQAIRRVLVDYAVRRNAQKREGGFKRVDLDRIDLNDPPIIDDADLHGVIELNQALERLEALEPRHVRVVECRFFGGMNLEETALALGISKATVKRDWTLARAWLNRELADG